VTRLRVASTPIADRHLETIHASWLVLDPTRRGYSSTSQGIIERFANDAITWLSLTSTPTL
jgi:hypothetical protein